MADSKVAKRRGKMSGSGKEKDSEVKRPNARVEGSKSVCKVKEQNGEGGMVV